MPIILFVEKNGDLKEMKLKEVVPEELYRKASFKTAEGFDVKTTWSKPGVYNISLYARKTGRPGSENKYDFPPPVESDLFFGGCILTNQDIDGNYCDLKKSTWEKIYEELFGGFEDLGSEDSESSDEDKDIPRTKEGYAKDGFIVDDAEDVESETSEESESENSEDVEVELEDEDDVDTDDLCEEDDGEEDVSDSEVEVEDEDEDEDDGGDFYNSDDDGPKQKKKKPAKKAAKVAQKSTSKKGSKSGINTVVGTTPIITGTKRRAQISGVLNTRSKATKKVVSEPTENGDGYLNCSDELEEEEYLE